jgi:hypothetical protein
MKIPTPLTLLLLVLIKPVLSPSWAKAPPPSHHLLTVIQAPVSSTPVVPPRPFRGHPRGTPPWPGAAARSSYGEPPPRPCLWSTVDQRRPWSTNHGPSPRLFPLENNSKLIIPCHFAKRTLFLSNINPQYTKILRRPLVFEIFQKNTPSHFPEITNRSLYFLFAISSQL